jgi:RHS repeat-associated protein
MTNSRATPCVKGNGDGLINSFNVGCLSDAMGNAATRFEWDAENRLTAAYSAFPQAGDKKVTFKYDYLNRRVEKNVYDWTGSAWSATPSQVRRFVYAGHLLLMEVDGGNNIVRKYSWGLDLAGQAGGRGSAEPGSGLPEALEAAGGIGGLLAVYDLNDTPGAEQTGDDLQYIYAYDGNGNVVQVLDWSASSATAAIVAKYEYDPYGNVVAQAGAYAERNPFRFSTKYWDDETGLGYWGYRYYSSRLGRWIGRDLIGEEGGLHLYAYALNRPVSAVDPLGESPTCTYPDPPEPFSEPQGKSVDTPWVLWLYSGGRSVVIDPNSNFGAFVRALPAAQILRSDANGNLKRKLDGRACKCCGPDSFTSTEFSESGGPFDIPADFQLPGRDPWKIWAFGNIGNLHLTYYAECRRTHCCTACFYSCRILYHFYDHFHWSVMQRGPRRLLREFWWSIVEQDTLTHKRSCFD